MPGLNIRQNDSQESHEVKRLIFLQQLSNQRGFKVIQPYRPLVSSLRVRLASQHEHKLSALLRVFRRAETNGTDQTNTIRCERFLALSMSN